MTSSDPTARLTATGRRPRPRWLVVGAIVVLVGFLGAAAVGAWYLFLRPAPAAVSLGSLPTSSPGAGGASPGGSATAAQPTATQSTATNPATAGSTDGPAATPTGTTSAGSGPASSTTLEGAWAVDSTIGSFSDFSSSFVGYRVQEVLGSIGAATAVGRTANVTGTLALEGATITSVTIEADLSTLESDNSMRDGQLRRQALETSTYPSATFALTTPIDLGALPADGQTITATATGDLTLHGQTQRVEIPIEARLSGSVITVVGSLPIVFADYGIAKPSSQSVLSIDDHGIMEFQLHFTRS